MSVVFATAISVILAACAVAQEKYRVRLTEYDLPGDKAEVSIDAEQKLTMSVVKDTETVSESEQTNQIKFEATTEVISVDDRSFADETRVIVKRAVLHSGDRVIELLQPGSVLLLRQRQRQTEYLDEETKQPIDARVANLLRRFLNLVGDEPRADEIFGTPATATVGAKWEADVEEVVEFWAAKGLKFDKGRISAEAILDSVAEVDGKTVVITKQKFSAKTDQPQNPPPGLDPVSAEVDAEYTLHNPADASSGQTYEELTLSMVGTFTGQAGTSREGQEATFSSKETRKARFKWLSYAPRERAIQKP